MLGQAAIGHGSANIFTSALRARQRAGYRLFLLRTIDETRVELQL